MTDEQRDNLLISVSTGLNTVQETLLEMRKEFKQDLKNTEDNLRVEFKQDLKNTEDNLRAEFKQDLKNTEDNLRAEFKQDLKNTEDNLRAEFHNTIDIIVKDTADNIRYILREEAKEHKSINKKIVTLANKLKAQKQN